MQVLRERGGRGSPHAFELIAEFCSRTSSEYSDQAAMLLKQIMLHLNDTGDVVKAASNAPKGVKVTMHPKVRQTMKLHGQRRAITSQGRRELHERVPARYVHPQGPGSVPVELQHAHMTDRPSCIGGLLRGSASSCCSRALDRGLPASIPDQAHRPA